MTPSTDVSTLLEAVPASVAISARVLLLSGDRVLLANERGQHWFHLPGGPVRAGETVEAAARRTVMAQSAISLDHLVFAGCVEVAAAGAGSRVTGIDVLFTAEQPWGADIGSRLDDLDIVSVALDSLSRLALRPPSLRKLITNWIINARPAWYGAASD